MKLVSFIFCYVALFLNLFACVNVYGKLSLKTIKFSIGNILALLIFTFATFMNNYYPITFLKLFLSIFIVFLMYIYYFRENIFLTLFKLLIIYLVLYLSDFTLSIVFLFFPYNSFVDLGNLTILKALCTFLVSLLLILAFMFDFILNFFKNIVNHMMQKINFLFLIVSLFTLLIFMILIYLYAIKLNFLLFLIAILLISFFLFLCVIVIIQYFKNKHNEEEQKSLLSLMNEYERVLDSDRMNRHEMLNNLITLKTYKNKSSEDYEKLIDGIIKDYQIKKSEFYSKLYKLPSGVKGIIYYKIANIKDKDINVELVISKAVKDKFENLNSRLYFRVCKILGIIIDNAIEAASEAMDKNILIDIYLEDENIIFYIENSFSSNIDLDRITEKGESSKGSNRGYGLFIASKLIIEKDDIDLEQHIDNNKFISILTIKNP